MRLWVARKHPAFLSPAMPKDQIESLSVDSRKVVYEGRIWDVVQETFQFAEQELVRDFVAHPGAVAVVAVDEENRILLINQYRHPVSATLWELPAGLRDLAGEPLEATARRELLEETGYVAHSLEPLISFFPSPGGLSEEIHVFVARGLTSAESRFVREGEEKTMTAQFFKLEVVVDSILNGGIKNGPCALAVLAFHASLAKS
jgi:8-oxo-dGTP pyrophosphatase MutT (NUDIX family)